MYYLKTPSFNIKTALANFFGHFGENWAILILASGHTAHESESKTNK